jgi:hypothetical protein
LKDLIHHEVDGRATRISVSIRVNNVTIDDEEAGVGGQSHEKMREMLFNEGYIYLLELHAHVNKLFSVDTTVGLEGASPF